MKRSIVLAPALALVVAACSVLAPAVVAAERATCVELRAESPSGTVDAVCAGADELAPYVADIVSRRAGAPAKLSKPLEPVHAVALPLPSHPIERRRCTVWEHLPERDGGADGGK